MKHIQLQQKLEEKLNDDTLGKMSQCNFCGAQKQEFDFDTPKVIPIGCKQDKEHRCKYLLCAKAYNKMCKQHTKNK